MPRLGFDFICDDCGEVIPAGDPIMFNAVQEAVHKDCGEELHVKIAVSRKHLELAEAAILQEVLGLAQRAELHGWAYLIRSGLVPGIKATYPEG